MKSAHQYCLTIGLGCLLLLFVWSPLSLAAEWSWNGVERIVVIGDIHGDYDRFVKLLQDAEIVNDNTNWTGGKTHLVQLGDVLDRGPASRKIMDLLMKLEKQAPKAGGAVHALIGNHETMNIYGDLRYTSPEEYLAFTNADSVQVRHLYYEQTVADLREQAKATGKPVKIDNAFQKQWEDDHPLGWVEHRFALGPNGPYGKWIRSHNAVTKINDTLFVHGGIGPKYANVSPEVINETIRKELKDLPPLAGSMMADPEGPLWYRGLAQGDEREMTAHLETVLKNFGVSRIVVGHTTTKTVVMPRFGCRVIMNDVGLSNYYGGPPAFLVLENGAAYAFHRGRKLAIPCDSGPELLEYLKSAAALDPPPSPIEKVIQELEKKLKGWNYFFPAPLDVFAGSIPSHGFKPSSSRTSFSRISSLPAPCPIWRKTVLPSAMSAG